MFKKVTCCAANIINELVIWFMRVIYRTNLFSCYPGNPFPDMVAIFRGDKYRSKHKARHATLAHTCATQHIKAACSIYSVPQSIFYSFVFFHGHVRDKIAITIMPNSLPCSCLHFQTCRLNSVPNKAIRFCQLGT